MSRPATRRRVLNRAKEHLALLEDLARFARSPEKRQEAERAAGRVREQIAAMEAQLEQEQAQ